jgi:hypothetical protein
MRANRDGASPARRHFFHIVGAVVSGAALSAVSSPAEAQGKGPPPGKGRPNPSRGGPACFLRGTRIQTPHGDVRVECLSIGDRVVTAGGKSLPVKWIGRQRFTKPRSSHWPETVHPIRVARSALADNVPHADLYLSPRHALYLDGVLIEVKDLVNGSSIAPAMPADLEAIEYFHIELETHEVILAEGAPVETFLDRSGRDMFSNFVEYERLYGASGGTPMAPYAPVLAYSTTRAHMKALLRLGVSHIVDVRDPIQIAYDRIAARAARIASPARAV